nr:hypothetical protein [Tanacetum cinerariifolium]
MVRTQRCIVYPGGNNINLHVRELLKSRSNKKLAPVLRSPSSSDYSSDVVDLEEFGNDKPLFLPSNSAQDWGSPTKCDLFIMSPRKDVYKVASSPKNSPLSSSSSSDHVSEPVAIEEYSRTTTPL